MDLFEPTVAREKMHPHFLHALERATPEDRAVLESWADGFIDRDGKFVKEFQTTFNSAFWELYLFACLKELGLNVDFAHPAPDFVVPSGRQPMAIEATSANSGINDADESTLTVEQFMALERLPVVEKASIRLAGALRAKHLKYQNQYARLQHVQDLPFVIAVAPFDQPGFFVQNNQAMTRVLYKYDRPTMNADPKGGSPQLEHHYTETVEKPTGVEIDLGFFQKPDMQEISAVLFSSLATWSKVRALSADPNPNVWFETLRYDDNATAPRHEVVRKADSTESLLDGLAVFHNPYCDQTIDDGLFDGHPVTQYYYPPGSPHPLAYSPDGTLIARFTLTGPSEADLQSDGGA